MAHPVDAASSPLVTAVAAHSGGIEHVPSVHLALWLPALTVPQPWEIGVVDGSRVTRLLLRPSARPALYTGCEVLNLYRVPTPIPPELVLDNAGRALQQGFAEKISTSAVDTPARYGIVGAHAAGWVPHGDHQAYSQFRYYAINAAAGSALIEQGIVIQAEKYPTLAGEVQSLTTLLYRALLASIDRPHDPRL